LHGLNSVAPLLKYLSEMKAHFCVRVTLPGSTNVLLGEMKIQMFETGLFLGWEYWARSS